MFKTTSLFVRISLMVLTLAITASSQWSMSGEVIEVIDGKTIRILSQSGEIKVELQFIEIPEPGQLMYDRVKAHLRSLTKGKVVAFRPTRIGRDRTVGRVMLNNIDLSLQMLRDGAAWHVLSASAGQDAAEYGLYEATEATAKTEKIGIWSVAGLKPPWEVRAENTPAANRSYDAPFSKGGVLSRPKPGVWGDVNPAIGDVGALMNGYNARSRTGYVGTSLIELVEVDASSGIKMMVDLTYHYKEAAGGRKGVYVFTVVARSETESFSKDNKLLAVGEGKTIDLGQPKRTVSRENGIVREDLAYQIDRDVLERVANKDVVFKLGKHVFYPTGFKYLIFNLLAVS